MRTRTVLLAAAIAGGSAAISALTSVLLTRRADEIVNERLRRGYTAMAEAFFTMPPLDADLPPGRRAPLVLVQGEGGLTQQ